MKVTGMNTAMNTQVQEITAIRHVTHLHLSLLDRTRCNRIEFRLYGFYHYDRVIHYRTDGQDQGKTGSEC